MINMNTCKKCQRLFDPSTEFIYDTTQLIALEFYININNYCPECLESLNLNIMEITEKFKNN